ncbi:unnamed protein product [Arabidopsis lyrata]|nr:unnamed protein product [Arabidopsis lyrata]
MNWEMITNPSLAQWIRLQPNSKDSVTESPVKSLLMS